MYLCDDFYKRRVYITLIEQSRFNKTSSVFTIKKGHYQGSNNNGHWLY